MMDMNNVRTVAPLYSLRNLYCRSCFFVSHRSWDMMIHSSMPKTARAVTAISRHVGNTLLRFHIVEKIMLKVPVANASATTPLKMLSILKGLFAQDMPLIRRIYPLTLSFI